MTTQACDQSIRNQVLDPNKSYIVEAPAGSGKTELLVTRYVTLLSKVLHPERILAITFTVKAANEMKHRVLRALASANSDTGEVSEQLRTAAQAAVRQDTQQNWNLLHNSSRLNIMTIDSLNARLARKVPIHTGVYGMENISSTDSLYRQAANSLLAGLQEKPGSESSLERIFFHYGCDGNSLEKSLVHMLKKREQWLGLLTDLRNSDAEDLHSTLNRHLEKQAKFVSDRWQENLSPWLDKLEELSHFAMSNIEPDSKLSQPLTIISRGLPQDTISAINYWRSLQQWILTQKRSLLKSISIKTGFPPKAKGADCEFRKQQMTSVLDDMRAGELELLLQEQLPPAAYSEQQIQALIDFSETLLQAAGWLQLVHNEFNTTDFSGMGQKALAALGNDDAPALLAEQTYDRLEHILIDEFQDTSSNQYELLRLLVRDWSPASDNRSLFIVGDPKQSIYRFRQAEPGLFHIVGMDGIEHIKPVALELKSNFRSNSDLVDWYNKSFSRIFSRYPDYSIGETNYKESIAECPSIEIEAVSFHIADKDEYAATSVSRQLVGEIRELQARDDIKTIAILTHTRAEAIKAVAALREQAIGYHSIDLEPLDNKQHILDLISLTRALSNEQDTISWLALLRHPAIGMSLQDLVYLSSHGRGMTIWQTLNNPPSNISQIGKQQIAHIRNALGTIISLTWSSPWRQLVEDAWHLLGMEALLNSEETKQAQQFLTLLTEHSRGTLINFDAITDSLQQEHYSESPREIADTAIYIMTIHKAKGLEFDAVLLPGLERNLTKKGADTNPPFLWDTIVNAQGSSLILAPYKARQEKEKSVLYNYLASLEKRKEKAEQQRLLYVACTRARVCLRLFATLPLDKLAEPANNFAKWLLQAGVTYKEIPLHNVRKREPKELPILTRYPLPTTVKTADNHLLNDTPRDLQHIPKDIYPELRGTEIHHLIDKISSCKNLDEHMVDPQSVDRFTNRNRKQWLDLFRWRGVPIYYRQRLIDQAILAVSNIMNDPVGRWLLTRENARNEWKIQARNKDGTIITRILDRTFVEKNTRWIVDYKVLEQHSGESLEQLIARAKNQYQLQLQQYAEMIYPAEQLSIRLGLYLVLQPLWIDWQWDDHL